MIGRVTEVSTPSGPARVELDMSTGARSLLILGHGAGGDVSAPDLAAVRAAALAAHVAVVLITQPYRVAGRRAPAPAPRLDEAWIAACAGLPRAAGTKGRGRRLPWIVGGRSSGARVACRTAGTLGAAGVLALAFPLHPPGRPERRRAAELDTGLPTLVLNGDLDPFGVPDVAPEREVRILPGDRHDLRRDPPGLARLAVDWLARYGWAAP